MPATKLRPHFTFDEDRVAQLRAIAPEAFADGRVNWEALQEALGEHLEADDEREHFGLFWPGKKDARRQAGVPPVGTLVPKPGEGVDEDTTRNIFIEGENLEVLKLLQKSYAGRVKMIYIDPPYNTGNDFVYDDNFTEGLDDYLRRTGMIDEEGRRLTTNSKADGRFHSKWLSMMFPRLRLAWNLLRDDGVIFVSIDDSEVHHLRMLMNEVFGEENFIGEIIWQRSKKGDAKLIATIHEYILVAAKNKVSLIEEGIWRIKKPGADDVLEQYEVFAKKHKGNHEKIEGEMAAFYAANAKNAEIQSHKHYRNSDDRGLYFADNFAGPNDGRKSRPRYDIIHPVTGKPCKKPSTGWRWDEKRTAEALIARPMLIHFGKDETTIPCRKSYLKDIDSEPFASVFYRDGRGATLTVDGLVGKGVFNFPKDKGVLKDLITIATEPDDIILDFFAGSGTTGHAVFELNYEELKNRHFILVQLAEQIEKESAASLAGYKTIADVTVKRLKKSVKILDREPEFFAADLGFKVFALRHSNYKTWEDATHTDIAKLELQFADAADPLIDGWRETDLLAEVMLLEGFPLDSRVELVDGVKGNRVHRVTSDFHEHSLLVCLDKTVKPQTIANLALQPTDVLITLDSALTDEQKLALGDKGMLRTI